MTISNNEEVARKWFEELWGIPDFDLADKIVDSDYNPEWIHIDKSGPEQVKYEIRYFRSIFPDLKYVITDIISSDDKVWVQYKGTGTQKGNAWGFNATQKPVEFEGVTILYFNHDGLIVNRWGAFCFYEILMGLGLVPPFWELHQHLK